MEVVMVRRVVWLVAVPTLVAGLAVGGLAPDAFAATARPRTATIADGYPNQRIVRANLRAIAKAIEKMRGKELNLVTRHLDEDTVKTLARHSSEVAARVEKVALREDLTKHSIDDALTSQLRHDLGGGAAKAIADDIADVAVEDAFIL